MSQHGSKSGRDAGENPVVGSKQGNESLGSKLKGWFIQKRDNFCLDSWKKKTRQRFAWLDNNLMLFYAILMALASHVAGSSFARFNPVGDKAVAYQENLFSGFILIAIAIVIVSLFESLRRNDLVDTAWVVAAIALNYFVISSGGVREIISMVYGLGFAMAYQASRSGKLDWTPLIAFNGAFIGLAAFNLDSNLAAQVVIWPVMVSVLFEVLEIFRNGDYKAVRLAYPGVAIALLGLAIFSNPIILILIGTLVSLVITPTVLRLEYNRSKKFGQWLSTCEEPCKAWDNGAINVRVNLESAMLTLIVSGMFSILMVIWF